MQSTPVTLGSSASSIRPKNDLCVPSSSLSSTTSHNVRAKLLLTEHRRSCPGQMGCTLFWPVQLLPTVAGGITRVIEELKPVIIDTAFIWMRSNPEPESSSWMVCIPKSFSLFLNTSTPHDRCDHVRTLSPLAIKDDHLSPYPSLIVNTFSETGDADRFEYLG